MGNIKDLFEGYGDVVEVAIGPLDAPEDDKAFEPNVGGGVEREDLAASDFVFSKERKFPVVIPKDVKDAVSSWGRYRGPRSLEDFKASLIRLCKRKGEKFVAALPEKWDVEKKEKAEEADDKPTQKCPKCEAEIPAAATTCPECEAEIPGEAEEEEEKAALENDAPESGQKMLARIWDTLARLGKELVGRKDQPVIDEGWKQVLDRLDQQGSAFKTFQAEDGTTWLLLWTTNAFLDRDKEIFTTQSIEEYVGRHVEDDEKGKFRFWHLPGTDFATIRWQGVSGRFLVEAAPFDETPTGQWFKEFFEKYPNGHPVIAPEGWGASHGYLYQVQDRKDAVYDWFEKRESSVLPAYVAANPYNPSLEVVPMGLSDRQVEALKAIGGDALVRMVTETGERRTKELEEAGVDFKEKNEEEPKAVPEQILDVAEALEDEDLKERLAAIAEQMKQAPEEEQPEEETKADSDAEADDEEEVEKEADDEEEEEAETEGDEEEEEKDLDGPEVGADDKTVDDVPSVPDAAELATKVAEALQLGALSELLENQKDLIDEQQAKMEELVAQIKELSGRVDETERQDEERLAEKELDLPRFSWFQASKAAESVLTDDEKDRELKDARPMVPGVIEMLSQP